MNVRDNYGVRINLQPTFVCILVPDIPTSRAEYTVCNKLKKTTKASTKCCNYTL